MGSNLAQIMEPSMTSKCLGFGRQRTDRLSLSFSLSLSLSLFPNSAAMTPPPKQSRDTTFLPRPALFRSTGERLDETVLIALGTSGTTGSKLLPYLRFVGKPAWPYCSKYFVFPVRSPRPPPPRSMIHATVVSAPKCVHSF